MKEVKWKLIFDRGKKTHKNYEVSSGGQLRSLDRLSVLDGSIIKGRLLCKNINDKGYETIAICGRTRSVHRLVAVAFIPNPENKPEINHINGIKTDNRAENLEWCTRIENTHHAIRMGLTKTKVNEDGVLFIRQNFKTMDRQELANMFGVSKAYIYSIAVHRDKKHIKTHIFQTNSPIPCKAVNQYDLEGNFIKTYKSTQFAADSLKTKIGRIQEVIKGYRKSHHGFIFKYVDEELNKVKYCQNEKKNGRNIEVTTVEGTYIGVFKMKTEAARFTKVNIGEVKKCLAGLYKQSKGYIFKYA